MGNKNADIKTLERLYSIICDCPGVTINDLHHATGLEYASIQSRLVSMVNHGMLISEDANAGLHPFDGDINQVLGALRSAAGLR